MRTSSRESLSIPFSLKNRCNDSSNLHVIELGTRIRIDGSECNSLEHAGRNAEMHVDILRSVHFIGLLQCDDVLRVVETLVCVHVLSVLADVILLQQVAVLFALSVRIRSSDDQLLVHRVTQIDEERTPRERFALIGGLKPIHVAAVIHDLNARGIPTKIEQEQLLLNGIVVESVRQAHARSCQNGLDGHMQRVRKAAQER